MIPWLIAFILSATNLESDIVINTYPRKYDMELAINTTKRKNIFKIERNYKHTITTLSTSLDLVDLGYGMDYTQLIKGTWAYKSK